MPDPFRLPRIKNLDRIVDALGRPTVQFIKFFNTDFAGSIERQEAAQAATDAALQAQIDRINRILAGTEEFTGLNMGGTNVKPFLDKTDGAKLTDNAGLDTSLVTTPKINANAVTDQLAAETTGVQALSGTTPVNIQSLVYVSDGSPIEVRANFYMTIWHPTAGGIDARVQITRGGVDIFDQTFTAINGDLIQGWMTPIVLDAPAAGSHVYVVTVTLSNGGAATQDVQATLLAVREYKR